MLFSDTFNQVLSKIEDYAPPNPKVKALKILNNTEKKCLTWIGGSLVTSLSTFQSYWIGKREYEEFGNSVLNTKHIW